MSALLQSKVRDVIDFPKKGIVFKDITPILQDPKAFRQAVNILTAHLKKKKVQYVVGIESRGFIFSPTISYLIKAGFVPVRKAGKLPFKTRKTAYSLEYGKAELEIHSDALPKGARVAIVDDLLATGGTAAAAAKLVESLGSKVVSIAFLIELAFLHGRKKLSKYDVFSAIQY